MTTAGAWQLKAPAFGWDDDTTLCADHMSPHLRALVDYAADKYKNGTGAIWANLFIVG
jgi:hypothetical protein